MLMRSDEDYRPEAGEDGQAHLSRPTITAMEDDVQSQCWACRCYSQMDPTAVKFHPVIPGEGYSHAQGSGIGRRTFVSTITFWGGCNFPLLG